MESNQNTQKNKSNNLWIGELDQSMDENYLRESCQRYNKSFLYIIIEYFYYRHKSKECKNN